MSDWCYQPARAVDSESRARAEKRQAVLTKPQGALGRLEQLAVDMAGWQHTDRPSLDNISILVFAADHGVALEGVSAYPQTVTAEMVRNFANGGAAINVLARLIGADLDVVDVGTATDIGALTGVRAQRINHGTANFIHRPAMQPGELERALGTGRDAVARAAAADSQLIIGGEMGIANTTAATAIACALLQQPASRLTGPGTGLAETGVRHKIQIIETALDRHAAQIDTPLNILQSLGGFEIAALSGCYLASAQQGIPALVDGFIASVAALVAVRLNPSISDWLIYAHRSTEPGHGMVLEALHAVPLLDLNMRLGEGSGAAVAVPLLQQALALHNGMATFTEAGISGPGDE